jgi:hypothetical protein
MLVDPVSQAGWTYGAAHVVAPRPPLEPVNDVPLTRDLLMDVLSDLSERLYRASLPFLRAASQPRRTRRRRDGLASCLQTPRVHPRYRLHPPLFREKVYRARLPGCRTTTSHLHRDDRLPFWTRRRLDEPATRSSIPVTRSSTPTTRSSTPATRSTLLVNDDQSGIGAVTTVASTVASLHSRSHIPLTQKVAADVHCAVPLPLLGKAPKSHRGVEGSFDHFGTPRQNRQRAWRRIGAAKEILGKGQKR